MKDLKVLAGILMAGFMFGFAACKTETDSTVAVEKIEITSTVKEVTEGEKITLTATVSPENATDKTVTWTSSDITVATVDENGVVTGVKAGSAIITAKAGEQSATVDITVNAKVIDVTSVEITSTVTSVIVGEKITLEAKVNPENATNKNVTWTSSDTIVATVDEKGVVTGVKAGKTTITAKAGEQSASVEITVNAKVIDVTGIEITSTEKEVAVGSPITFKATVSPDTATYKTVTWTSSVEDVATVDSNGVVTGLKAGKTTITATAGGKSDSVEITVIIPVESVKITSKVTQLNNGINGGKITLTASVSPENATTDKTITWASDNEAVATVDEKGVVTRVSDGKVTISAKAGEKTDSVEITVKTPVVGDIILTDGTTFDVANLASYTTDESNKPVAIVAGFNAKGAVLGLGLQKSGSTLFWAPIGTTGYTTNFTDIIAKYARDSDNGYTFTGDLDGSDNWEYICSVDSEGTKDAAKNYPAFNFANTYGTNQSYTGDLATGWYIPSIAELYKVYQNKTTLQTSLTAVGGFTIGTGNYWSSSQSSNGYNYAYDLGFSDGYIYGYDGESYNYNVLVVRAF